MVDRVIKIQEQQLHNSCPVAEQIKYHQQLACDRGKALVEYARMVEHLNETIRDNEKTICLRLSRIYDLESQIENLNGRLKEQEISSEELKELKRVNRELKERVDELEELIANSTDRLDNIMYDLRNI